MDGKLGPTIQKKNMVTITLYPKFNKTKISPWPGLAHQKSRCQKLWSRCPRQRRAMLPPRPMASLTVITNIIITVTGERRKPRSPGRIKFGVYLNKASPCTCIFISLDPSTICLNGFPSCLGCIFGFLLSSGVALSDFGHVDWRCEGYKVDKTCSLEVGMTLVTEHMRV